MTDDLFRPPFGAEDHDEDDGLPEHERDDDRTIGGGMMGAGGTATDRGTGELTGDAQGRGDDDEAGGMNEGMVAGMPAGGAQPYVPAFIDDDEDGGSLPDGGR